MALKFSRITAKSNNSITTFLVGGVPETQKDLEPWTEFQKYIKDVRKDDAIILHVETFIYGNEIAVDATPEEVAYLYQRISMRPDFIESRTKKCNETDIIMWIEK